MQARQSALAPSAMLWLRKMRKNVPSAVLFVILFFLIVLPVSGVVFTSLGSTLPREGITSFSLDLSNYAFLSAPHNRAAVVNSMIIGVGGTALALIFGCGLALLASRTNVPLKPLARVAGVVPLFTESLIGALAWSVLGSPRQGYLNIFFRQIGIPVEINIYSIGGIVFVMGLYYAPYVFLFVSSGLALMDPQLEEAARASGANTSRIMRTVTLPMAAPAILGSGLLSFILIVENFSVPELLGAQANLDTIPSRIYDMMTAIPPQPNRAAAMGMTLMALMIIILVLQRRYTAVRQFTTVSGKGIRPAVMDLGPWRWLGLGFVLFYLLVAVGLPYFALIQMGARPYFYVGSLSDLFGVNGYSLSEFSDLLHDDVFVRSLRNTVIVGVSTALVGGLFLSVLAYVVFRTKLTGRRTLEFIAMSPLAIPALLMGMGIAWVWLSMPIPLYGTLAILVIAYVARFSPHGFRGMASSIQAVHRDLEDSAFVCGASRVRAAAQTTFRLIRPGVVSTALLLMLLAMRELSASLFLFTSDTVVVSIQVFNTWDSGRIDRAAAMSLLYSLLLLVVTLLSRAGSGKSSEPV